MGGNFPVLMLQIMSDAPPSLVAQRPDVPTELFAVIERALDKANDRRCTDLAELGEALKPFELIDEPPHYVPIEETTPERPAASTRRLRGPRRPRIARSSTALMVAAVGGLCLLGLGFQLRGRRSSIEISGAHTGAAAAQVTLQVDSPVEGAQLRFRGALHALPFSQKLSSTQEREPIEVTAPGHRGRRFWLLLDRDHTLRVDLDRGQGIADASESERARAVVAPQP